MWTFYKMTTLTHLTLLVFNLRTWHALTKTIQKSSRLTMTISFKQVAKTVSSRSIILIWGQLLTNGSICGLCWVAFHLASFLASARHERFADYTDHSL